MNTTIIIVILCICFIIYFVWCNYFPFNENIYITSTIDNRKYLIRRGKNKPDFFLQQSADTLAEINRRVDLLINKVMLDEYLTKQEKNRLYNYIDYKISKNKNDTNEWIYIRNKLDI